jgi:tRNA G46 methylase TrmB
VVGNEGFNLQGKGEAVVDLGFGRGSFLANNAGKDDRNENR